MAQAYPLVEFKVDQTRFQRYLDSKARAYRQANRALKEANRRSLQWITERSIANLRTQVASTGRAPDTRHARLASVMANPAVSSYDGRGFQFMIHARVDIVNARIAAYYRVIEGRPGDQVGSDYWVRRTSYQSLGLLFEGPSGPGGQAVSRAGWWPASLPQVQIRRPIPAYHYAYRARESFTKAHLYGRFINEELRNVGIDSKLVPR